MSIDQTIRTLNVDLAALATAVGQRMHEADMTVTPAQSEQYARSLQLAKPSSRHELYLTTRAIFVTDMEQVATFDRVFAELFGARAETSPSADTVQSNPGPAHAAARA